MKIIAWDTSSKVGCLVALEWDEKLKTGWDGVRLVAELTLNIEATHSEQLLWGIHQLLSACRWKLQEIHLFGVGLGPGSFTSLRIGLTTARTIAHSLKKPLIGVSSLAVLARPVALWLEVAEPKAVLVASTDACKGELYALWGSSRSILDCVVMGDSGSSELWKRGVEEKVISPPELMKSLKRKMGEKKGTAFWVAIGEGRSRYPESWKTLPLNREIRVPALGANQVQGKYLGLLVWQAFQSGLSRSALQVHPRYLRLPDAELKLKKNLAESEK